jgi:hypothetical protein
MNGRYRTRLGWRIFILLGAPPLAALFIYVLTLFINAENPQMFVLLFMVPLCLAMIGLMLYGIGDAIIGYYEIDDNFITHRTILRKKIVPLANIYGVSVNQNYIHLKSKEGKDRINITSYIEKRDQIIEWAYENFEDIDAETAEAQDIEVLREVTQDIPVKEHDIQLEKAKKNAKYLNWAGYGSGLWALLYPHPYELAVAAAMLAPIITIIAIWRFKGFLRYNGFDKSRYPIMLNPMIVSICGLVLRALFDFEILDHGNLWIEAGTVSIAVMTVAVLTSKQFSFKTLTSAFTIVFFVAFFYAYAISSMIIINCRFDSSDYQAFEARVLDKETSGGKTTTYYLDLTPWGPRTEHEKVSVGRHGYERANVGDTVEVYLYKGRLKAPWFELGIE